MVRRKSAVQKAIGKAVLLVLYIIFWAVTWAGLLANLNATFPTLRCKRTCRVDMAFAMGLAAIPVASWVMAPFLTGFYEDGFQFSCAGEPAKDSYGN